MPVGACAIPTPAGRYWGPVVSPHSLTRTATHLPLCLRCVLLGLTGVLPSPSARVSHRRRQSASRRASTRMHACMHAAGTCSGTIRSSSHVLEVCPCVRVACCYCDCAMCAGVCVCAMYVQPSSRCRRCCPAPTPTTHRMDRWAARDSTARASRRSACLHMPGSAQLSCARVLTPRVSFPLLRCCCCCRSPASTKRTKLNSNPLPNTGQLTHAHAADTACCTGRRHAVQSNPCQLTSPSSPVDVFRPVALCVDGGAPRTEIYAGAAKKVDTAAAVKKLTEMGFPAALCAEALDKCKGDENAAVDWLMSHC